MEWPPLPADSRVSIRPLPSLPSLPSVSADLLEAEWVHDDDLGRRSGGRHGASALAGGWEERSAEHEADGRRDRRTGKTTGDEGARQHLALATARARAEPDNF